MAHRQLSQRGDQIIDLTGLRAHVEHPAAQSFFTPELARDFDCYVLYDMPGIEFKPGATPVFFDPPDDSGRDMIGEMVNIRITKTTPWSLQGKLVATPVVAS